MSREAAVKALLKLVSGAYPWKTAPSRRLKLWGDVPLAARPAAFLHEGGNEVYVWQGSAIQRRTIEVKLFVYTDEKSPTAVGASDLNAILEALDAAFALSASDKMLGRNTLGGAAYWCRIDGNVFKDPGDLDGEGMLILPIRITLP